MVRVAKMKGLIGSLLATLLGTAMLVVGIAGVAGAFDNGSGSTSDEAGADVADFDTCPTTDDRFADFGTFDFSADAGSATVIRTCRSTGIELSMVSTSLTTDKPRALALWLYNNRKDAALIATTAQEPGDDTVVISGTLPDDSEDYKKLVVTEEPASAYFEDPDRPTKVILQARP